MPETTSTDCSDLDQNEPTILVPSSSTVDIAVMVGKMTLRNSNGEESDASSDGGGEASGTKQPLNSGTSYTIEIDHRNQSPSVDSNSSVVSDGSWTNSDRDQERQRRSRSSSECSDSSCASSDSLPPEVCVVERNALGFENILNNFNKLRVNDDRQNVAETTERDVDSNGAKKTTDDLDYESSSDDDQDSEDEAAANDTAEQYTQRGGPTASAAKRSPPHAMKPYDGRRDQNSSYAVRETRDRYRQEPEDTTSCNLPDFRLWPSMTSAHNADSYNIPISDLESSLTREQVETSAKYVEQCLRADPEGFSEQMLDLIAVQEILSPSSNFEEQTIFDEFPASSVPSFVIDVSPNNLPLSPSPTHQRQFYTMRQNPPSIGSLSPDSSVYNSQTPSPTRYTNGSAVGVEDITGSMDGWNIPIYSRSPGSDSGMHAGAAWSGNDSTSEWPIAFDSPQQYLMDSVHQPHPCTSELGTTTSTMVVNSSGAGLVTVNTQPTISLPEVIQHPTATEGNANDAELHWVREGILNTNQFEPKTVIPTTVRDLDNTPDDSVKYVHLLTVSLDTKRSRSADTFMESVPFESVISNVVDLLGRKNDEFSAVNDDGNTYAMVLLHRIALLSGREDVIGQRVARLLVTLEKMRNVPTSFEAINNKSNHDLLYMAAINFEGKYPFITGLVLEKMFKAVGPNSRMWTRTYDHLGNTLIHIVIAKGPKYVYVLRELLDVKTTGNQTVFSLLAVNKEGKKPYDLAVAADSGRNGNYTAITRMLLHNYRTPVDCDY